MKKLSAVQLKQQALVFSVADSLEAQALEELNGMQQCWFDVQYHQFPGSLLLRFQFENEAVLPGKCLVIILSFFGIKSTYTLSGK